MSCYNNNCNEIVSSGCIKWTGPTLFEDHCKEFNDIIADIYNKIYTEFDLSQQPIGCLDPIPTKTIQTLLTGIITKICSLSVSVGALIDQKPYVDAQVAILMTLINNNKTTTDAVIATIIPYVDAQILIVKGLITSALATAIANSSMPLNAILMTDDLTKFDPLTGLGRVDTPWNNWALCDGRNNTPNLKGKFVVGYDPNDTDYSNTGTTGGEKRHLLTIPEMPSHTHTAGIGGSYSQSFNGGNNTSGIINSGQLVINPTGGGQSHENRPPYYTLVYAKKIA